MLLGLVEININVVLCCVGWTDKLGFFYHVGECCERLGQIWFVTPVTDKTHYETFARS